MACMLTRPVIGRTLSSVSDLSKLAKKEHQVLGMDPHGIAEISGISNDGNED